MGEIPTQYEPEFESADEVIEGEDVQNAQYSDKGSHRARSEFWHDVRRGVPTQIFPDKNMEHIIRRSMNRVSRDGK